jgi:hypothetical protein
MLNEVGWLFTYTLNNNRFAIIIYSRAGNIIDIKQYPPYGIEGKYQPVESTPKGYIDEEKLSRQNLFGMRFTYNTRFLRKYGLEC